jgi:hypothetical protein
MRTALLWLAAALAAAGARAGDARAADDERAASDQGKAPAKAEGAAGDGETFEALAKDAQPAADVGALLGALTDRCADEKRALDRARCQATLAYLRKTLPEHPFTITARDPAAISISAYDGALKGYRIGLSACVACGSPTRVGRSPEPVFVTLKKPGEARSGTGKAGAPAAGADSLAAAVEIASLPLGFPSQAEARRWLAEVRPHLRAELVFNATASEWKFRSTRGYALGLVAGRIVDACTGAVVLSSPPSTGLAHRAAREDEDCASAARVAAKAEAGTPGATPPPDDSDEDDEDKPLPTELTRAVIAQSMGRIRGQVFACFERFRVPGVAPLTYEVAGNGTVQSVKLGGALAGTPSGDCITEAARAAGFPRFDGPVQTFTYPFFLRR